MKKTIFLTTIVAQSFEIFRNGQGVVALKITETRISTTGNNPNTEFFCFYLRKCVLNRCSENTAQRSELIENKI